MTPRELIEFFRVMTGRPHKFRVRDSRDYKLEEPMPFKDIEFPRAVCPCVKWSADVIREAELPRSVAIKYGVDRVPGGVSVRDKLPPQFDPMRGGILRRGKRKRPSFSWPARLALFVIAPLAACSIAAGAWVLWRVFIRHMCV